MVSCDLENFGCGGGFLINSVDYLVSEGVVSESCMPYQEGDTQCTFACTEPGKYQKHYCRKGSLRIMTSRKDIMKEIYRNGPVMTGMTIYEDLFNYQSGIYEHVAGQLIGGHAVKLLGWGHDEEAGFYWKAQNQWSEEWGEKGFFRIKHGQVGIDAMAMTCDPDII